MFSGERWWSLGLSAGRRVSRALLDFAFPRGCVLCRGDLSVAGPDDDLPLCLACRKSLPVPDGTLCPRCGATLGPYVTAGAEGCVHCRRESYAFAGAVSLGLYDGSLRNACLRGKHGGALPLLATLAELLVARRSEEIAGWNCDVIVPVPQHWTTRCRRPHNPAQLIAESMSRRLGIPLSHRVLRKVRRTPQQVSLTATGRRKNLRGAFRVRRLRSVRNLRVLLVDDVLTTGSTAHACSRALRAGGAAEIFTAVLARSLG